MLNKIIEDSNLLNDELENISKKMQKYQDDYEKEMNELRKKQDTLLDELETLNRKVFDYSSFNGDVIGEAIANLLTSIYDKQYYYSIVKLTGFGSVYYSCGGGSGAYENYEFKIPIRIISVKPFMISGNEVPITEFRKYVNENADVIILDKNENESDKLNNKINLYNDYDLDLILNEPFETLNKDHYFKVPLISEEKLELIKGFIDVLVDYKLSNKIKNLRKQEINDFLEKYIDERKLQIGKTLTKHITKH